MSKDQLVVQFSILAIYHTVKICPLSQQPESTIKAITSLLGLLKKGGIIAISVYDGHEGGREERDALLDYVKTLHQADVHVIRYELLNQRNNPPFLVALEKMKEFETVRQVD